MFLSKIFFLLTLFLSTQQELYWNFISSEELSSKMFDLSQFLMYNNSNIPTRICLLFLSVEHVYIPRTDQCNTYCNDKFFFTKENLSETGACHLHGFVTKAQFLRSFDNRDGLMFVQLEGCYSIDENGRNSSGAILVTNDVNKNYNQKLNVEYFWTTIDTLRIKCNMLCQDVIFDRCFVEMDENQTKKYLETFQHVSEIFYLKPLPETYSSYNGKTIFIIFGAAFVIFSVSLLLSIVYRKLHKDFNKSF